MVPRARQLLAKNTDTTDWNYGNIIHDANQVLGLAALANKDISRATQYLYKAGKTPGSPQLDSFGPVMLLAQVLLDRGHPKATLKYLDLVEKFWVHSLPGDRNDKVAKLNAAHLADWRALIKAGRKPRLNCISDKPSIPLG